MWHDVVTCLRQEKKYQRLMGIEKKWQERKKWLAITFEINGYTVWIEGGIFIYQINIDYLLCRRHKNAIWQARQSSRSLRNSLDISSLDI